MTFQDFSHSNIFFNSSIQILKKTKQKTTGNVTTRNEAVAIRGVALDSEQGRDSEDEEQTKPHVLLFK